MINKNRNRKKYQEIEFGIDVVVGFEILKFLLAGLNKQLLALLFNTSFDWSFNDEREQVLPGLLVEYYLHSIHTCNQLKKIRIQKSN